MSRFEPFIYALFRMVFGLLFLFHGLPKIFGIYGRTVELMSLRGVAGIIELVCGCLIVLGVGTRAAAFLASGQMAVAYFYVHQPRGIWPIENGGELAALYCFAFLFIASRGSSFSRLKKGVAATIFCFLAFGARAEPAHAQQLAPKIQFGRGTLDIHGWAHSIYGRNSDSTAESVRLRVRFTKSEGFGGFLDLDLPNLTKQGGIKRVALTYNASPNFQVLVGRFPTSGFYFAPSDIVLETVQYARTPFAFYATGVQLNYRSKKGWSAIADVTGNSSKRAYDITQIDRVEFSGRLTVPLGRVMLSQSVQISEEFARISLDIANSASSRFRYRAFAYTASANGVGTAGGYGFISYALAPWIEQHNQLDIRRQKQELDPIIINGLRLKTRPEWVILTLEHQWYPERKKKRDLFVRAQLRF